MKLSHAAALLILSTALALFIPSASGDDKSIKRNLVGFWRTSDGMGIILKEDGVEIGCGLSSLPCHEDGPGSRRWEVKDGVFHTWVIEETGETCCGNWFKIISLTKEKLVIQDMYHGQHTGTWTRAQNESRSAGISEAITNERIKELQEENDRLRAAAKNEATSPAESPSKDEIANAIRAVAEKIPMASTTSNYGRTYNFTGKLDGYTINNEFTKTIDDETYHVYDVGVTIKGAYGLQKHNVMVGLVRRGRLWYSIRLDPEKEPAIHSRYQGR